MESANITIRQAGTNDIDQLAILFDRYRVFYKRDSDLNLAVQYLTQRLNNNEATVFVAEQNDNLIGFTLCYPLFSSVNCRPVVLLNDLYVDKEYRSKGIGKKLIDSVSEFAMAQGAISVQLETEKSNVGAQALYDKLGFDKDLGHYYYSLKITS